MNLLIYVEVNGTRRGLITCVSHDFMCLLDFCNHMVVDKSMLSKYIILGRNGMSSQSWIIFP